MGNKKGSDKFKLTANEQIKNNIIKALSDPKWEYRTIMGLSKTINAPVPELERTLNNMRETVRVSFAKTIGGDTLYALKERKSLFGDAWTAFKSINAVKFGGDK